MQSTHIYTGPLVVAALDIDVFSGKRSDADCNEESDFLFTPPSSPLPEIGPSSSKLAAISATPIPVTLLSIPSLTKSKAIESDDVRAELRKSPASHYRCDIQTNQTATVEDIKRIAACQQNYQKNAELMVVAPRRRRPERASAVQRSRTSTTATSSVRPNAKGRNKRSASDVEGSDTKAKKKRRSNEKEEMQMQSLATPLPDYMLGPPDKGGWIRRPKTSVRVRKFSPASSQTSTSSSLAGTSTPPGPSTPPELLHSFPGPHLSQPVQRPPPTPHLTSSTQAPPSSSSANSRAGHRSDQTFAGPAYIHAAPPAISRYYRQAPQMGFDGDACNANTAGGFPAPMPHPDQSMRPTSMPQNFYPNMNSEFSFVYNRDGDTGGAYYSPTLEEDGFEEITHPPPHQHWGGHPR